MLIYKICFIKKIEYNQLDLFIKEAINCEFEKNKEFNYSYISWFYLPQSPELIYEKLKSKNLQHLFNFLLIINFFTKKLDYSVINKIELLLYTDLTENQIKLLIIKNFQKVIEAFFNEMLKKDFDIIKKNNLWLGVKLDSLYNVNFEHLNLNPDKIKIILPKYKDTLLAERVIKRHLVLSTIERFENFIIYDAQKAKKGHNYPSDLLESIPFTRGYLLCVPVATLKKLRYCKYVRKLPSTKPIFIKITTLDKTFKNLLTNNSYSYPIWMKQVSAFYIKNLETIDIYNKHLLNSNYDITPQLSALNHLNGTPFTCNWGILNNVIKCLNTNEISKSLATKEAIKGKIYIIEPPVITNELNSKITTKNDTIINSAASIDLIATQFKDYPLFYLTYRLDFRSRFYVYQWPLNYQLSHIVRISLRFVNNINIEKLWLKFFEHPLIKKHLYSSKLFYYQWFDIKELLKFVNDRFNLKILDIELNQIEDKLTIEAIIIFLIKLAPKRIRDLKEQVDFGINVFDEFIKSDLISSKNLLYWCDKLEIKIKKYPYLLYIQKNLLSMMNGDFESPILWSDASSSAIQLITLRLGFFNEKLLMLTNIIDNETDYENIYEYMTHKISSDNHEFLCKLIKISPPLTNADIATLQEKDLNKFLIMPSSYGMGQGSYRINVNKILTNNKKKTRWNEFSNEQKNVISDYFWKRANEHLKNIGFNLESYKKMCNDVWSKKNYEFFAWKNDCGMPIVPINFEKSRRESIEKSITLLKFKKKTTKGGALLKINKKIFNLNERLKFDERTHYSRAWIETKNFKIRTRVRRDCYKVDKNKTRQALIPNTIHAYDAAIINMFTNVCQELGIDLAVIHDSAGSNCRVTPLIKILFKIINIEFIEKARTETPFPLKTPIFIKNPENLYKKIIESKNFFR